MTDLGEIDTVLACVGLKVMGGFHPSPSDQVPEGCETLMLIGPRRDRFWDVFKHSAEHEDRQADPLDRWSYRVLNEIARDLGAEALFPFGEPPLHPFLNWAARAGQVFSSPVSMLVGAQDGLFVSFRGALAFRNAIRIPPPVASPCSTCAAQPCLSGCPIGALTEERYDVAACRAYISSPEGIDCRTSGCLVRRVCPASQGGQPAAQASFHMQAFLGAAR